ncbi:hypothetical protein IF1G_04800 [Cordyceps javanica]|uniref:Uncharacterized protein n=1 Tax=Cordyceps javanica TaxID=43265 RepID=A0A545V3D0_9HYPO|nr:hypothetical protein IF1G_04800 [Cordyceps javanica]
MFPGQIAISLSCGKRRAYTDQSTVGVGFATSILLVVSLKSAVLAMYQILVEAQPIFSQGGHPFSFIHPSSPDASPCSIDQQQRAMAETSRHLETVASLFNFYRANRAAQPRVGTYSFPPIPLSTARGRARERRE